MKNKKLIFFSFIFLICAIVLVNAETASSNPSFCCEKTKQGAYCINTDEQNCAVGFKSSPTSCETTSYCSLGTCYDSDEGICMENTPQQVCSDNGGTWDSRKVEEVPQCQLGCCIIADQAAFVPLVRCKKLSTLFGVANDYRTDITSEMDCIATAQAQDMGACVYEKEFERVCEFTTRKDCGAGNQVEEINSSEEKNSGERKFYKDTLCSAEELNTNCGRQTSTECYQGDVYWFDSCGNKENVYSSNKEKSWNNGKVAKPEEVCNSNDGSNKECGNCDYLLGSRCAAWNGFLGVGKPSESNFYCQKTECTDRKGDKRLNGESWCVYDGTTGDGKDSVGSRHFRELCIDGKVRVEPCEDYRNEVCISGAIKTDDGSFGTAACRVNRWQDCTAQSDQDDCENNDKRDCIWLDTITGLLLGGGSEDDEGSTSFSNPTASGGDAFNNPTASGDPTGNAILGGSSSEDEEKTKTNRPKGVCVPNFSPGLKFWESGSAQTTCAQASAKCVVVYEKGLLEGSWKPKKGEECLEEQWALEANRICTALGDCGGYVNYKGDYGKDGYEWKIDKDKKEFSPGAENKIRSGFTGLLIEKLT